VDPKNNVRIPVVISAWRTKKSTPLQLLARLNAGNLWLPHQLEPSKAFLDIDGNPVQKGEHAAIVSLDLSGQFSKRPADQIIPIARYKPNSRKRKNKPTEIYGGPDSTAEANTKSPSII